MSEETPPTITNFINHHRVRDVEFDETDSIAMNDLCACLRRVVERMVELNKRQQENMHLMQATLDAFHDVLATRYPEIRQEFLSIARTRMKLI